MASLEKRVDKAAEAAENQEIVANLRKKHPDYDSDSLIKYRTAGLLKEHPILATMAEAIPLMPSPRCTVPIDDITAT